MFAGTRGFDEWGGEVWGVHVAWSGNHTMFAERLPDGRRYLQGGELLHPGEIVARTGRVVLDARGARGLLAERAHAGDVGVPPARCGAAPTHPHDAAPGAAEHVGGGVLRSRRRHGCGRSPTRPPTSASSGSCSTTAGSDRGATTRAGSATGGCRPTSTPTGSAPLIAHVTGLGHGVRDLGRAGDGQPRQRRCTAPIPSGRSPPTATSRCSAVTNWCSTSAEPEAFEHVLGQLDALLRDHDIAYVKWDMNRDHVQGSGADGAAGTHAQTLAAVPTARRAARAAPRRRVRVVRERRRPHRPRDPAPHRAGVDQRLQRRARAPDHPARRVDADPARADGRAHRPAHGRTPPGRAHTLAFRAATAMFGHLGVEWNVTRHRRRATATRCRAVDRHAQGAPRSCCTAATSCASTPIRRITPTACTPRDRRRAIVSFAQLATAPSQTPPPLRLPGLDPDAPVPRRAPPDPATRRWGAGRTQPSWLAGRRRAHRPPARRPRNPAADAPSRIRGPVQPHRPLTPDSSGER